jgi:hypothetical protein
MICAQRTYQVHAGKAADFLKTYEANGLGIITRNARLIGCLISDRIRFFLSISTSKDAQTAASAKVCASFAASFAW